MRHHTSQMCGTRAYEFVKGVHVDIVLTVRIRLFHEHNLVSCRHLSTFLIKDAVRL